MTRRNFSLVVMSFLFIFTMVLRYAETLYSQDTVSSKILPQGVEQTMRMINKANQPASTWIKDEAAYLKKNRNVSNMSEPQSVQIGNSTWYCIEYEAVMGQKGSYKVKQFYTFKNDADSKLLEIAFAAKRDVFDSSNDAIVSYISTINLASYFPSEETASPGAEQKLSAAKETIYLKSGRVVKGRIIERTDSYVKVDFGGLKVYYPNKDIDRIEVGNSGDTIPNSHN